MICVYIKAGDGASVVDVKGHGAVRGACASSRNVERDGSGKSLRGDAQADAAERQDKRKPSAIDHALPPDGKFQSMLHQNRRRRRRRSSGLMRAKAKPNRQSSWMKT